MVVTKTCASLLLVWIRCDCVVPGNIELRQNHMPKLPKFTLTYNDQEDRWDVEKDKSHRVVKSFDYNDDATKRGALKKGGRKRRWRG
jgi:hypothetical protein